MLGDTAIAVSPKDPRFVSLIGKEVLVPFVNRKITIIADPFVDPEFATGLVKITPAHDPNDYEMGLRHKFEFINIMTPDGRINENGGEFQGLSMQEARLAVVDKMKKLGLVEKIEPHHLRVGVSYRSKAIIEPYLSKQWFVNMGPFKEKLKSAVQEKRVPSSLLIGNTPITTGSTIYETGAFQGNFGGATKFLSGIIKKIPQK